MKVVIDTNVLLVCISPRSKTNAIIEAIEKGALSMCITQDILYEYEEIFETNSGYIGQLLLQDLINYMPNLIFLNTYFKWNLITQDPDDNKFVDCAVAVGAEFIITEDSHFGVLKQIEFPKVQVISALEFIDNYLSN
jgi:uncharacterized protein